MYIILNPESVANAYSRFVSNVADNTLSALRTTNNLVFASLDVFKTTTQHTKDTIKQILDINTKTTQTLEQNAKVVQDSDSRFNTSITNNQQGDIPNTPGTTITIISVA